MQMFAAGMLVSTAVPAIDAQPERDSQSIFSGSPGSLQPP